jgi:hypothetical protein
VADIGRLRRGRASLGRSPDEGDENAAGWGRHTVVFLASRGHAARDVCANRTPRQDRARQRGKSGMLDSERIAQETLAHPLPPNAFKRAGQNQEGPDELHQLLALWHNRRRSILTSRQHLVNEAEHLLCELREQLPDSKAVRPRLAALQRRNRRRRYDPPTRLCLEILDRYHAQIKPLDREEKPVTAALEALVRQSGSTLGELCGLSPPGRSPSCWSRPATPAASRLSPLQCRGPVASLDRGRTRRACASPLQPRRQPAHQRDPAPDGHHPAALRAARPDPRSIRCA